MRKLTFILILLFALNLVYAENAFEEIDGAEFGLEEINNRKTYLEIADQLKNIFKEIDEILSKIDDSSISTESYDIIDLNTDEFNQLKLSEQLKLFQKNYNTLNSFTKDSLSVLQNNSKLLDKFYDLQLNLMFTFNRLLDEADRIQKSQEEDLSLALEEIKKAQSSTAMLQQNLDICRDLAEKQANKLKKARIGRWIFGGVGLGLGLGLGVYLTKQTNK